MHDAPAPLEKRRRPYRDDGLILIGLVGRAGSGKSTVARVLAQHGVEVVNADELGHVVTDQDPEVRARLEALPASARCIECQSKSERR